MRDRRSTASTDLVQIKFNGLSRHKGSSCPPNHIFTDSVQSVVLHRNLLSLTKFMISLFVLRFTRNESIIASVDV